MRITRDRDEMPVSLRQLPENHTLDYEHVSSTCYGFSGLYSFLGIFRGGFCSYEIATHLLADNASQERKGCRLQVNPTNLGRK
jgi:hypothetical protein